MSETNSNYQTIPQELSATADVSLDQQVIEEITAKILQHKRQVVQSFLEIGNLLIEAKKHLTKHGHWLAWLSTSVDISERMAQRYMQLATAFSNPTSVSDLGMTKALALLALPEAQREDFINEPHDVNGKQKTVNEMSVREIHRAIHEKMEPLQTDNIAAKGTGDPHALKVVHNPNRVSHDGERSETQTKNARLGNITTDIESAQTHLDNILKVLEKQASNVVEQGQLAESLHSIHKKILQCLNLAKIDIPSN